MMGVPFAQPDLTNAERAAVDEVLDAGWLTTGQRTANFESEFSRRLGGSSIRSLAVSSATAGLHLALDAIGVGPGDEVLVPTWTFTATAEVVRYMGARPILVDVDPGSLTIDWGHAASRITDRTKAVMPVHFAGALIPSAEIARFRSSTGLRVVEDAAHCLPSAELGRHLTDDVSDAVVFSFYATKPITTGEGGMVAVNQDGMASRISLMRLHGIDRDVFDRYRDPRSAWKYDVVEAGYKYNMPDMAAAMGSVQLKRSWQMRDRRRLIVAQYRDALRDSALDLPNEDFGVGEHAAHLCVARVHEDMDRDEFIVAMRSRGISCSVHFTPLHAMSYWRDLLESRPEQFPAASAEYGRVVSLPLYSSMRQTDVDCVIEAIKEVLP
jgi:dTDP-4-amino-4,6-dideoxygalactose transaminase